MAVRLSELYDMLVSHFQLEEESGLFESLLQSHPGRRTEITRIRRQHDQLPANLKQLIDQLSGPEAEWMTWGAAARRFEAFLDALNTHESTERELGINLAIHTAEPASDR